ncbi:MAG: iron ABC transporter permease [Armatimonadota bacterium]|nr:iron ABC transporter permease [Armatimonadota bacterium]MDR7455106.1 iron ABC transporter permease [Armatimonadota bacterium]MDR7456053.1 iron ABC transporter permease [Armatimonadota bacterium]MDR7495385.1 iron ABC transporter permease [Armatimonadota bacterium]MDR7511682.1 iron ABC transporter permease [Armatimonadota bacterium]
MASVAPRVRAAAWTLWGDPVVVLAAAAAVVLGFLALYPTVMLFVGSFSDAPLGVAGRFTLANYAQAYADPATYRLIATSVVFAAGAAALSVLLAGVLAWITVRTNAPGRALFELVALAPNVLPPLLIATSWVLLLSPRIGLINVAVLRPLGLPPLNVYSLAGMIFVEGLILAPLAFLIIASALRSMDPALEESARVCGSSTLQTARRITAPLVLPALLAAGLLNFVRAIESFDTPAIIALPARIEVLTTKIFREALAAFPPNHNLAATYAMSLLAITVFFVYVYRRLTGRGERFATITGRGYRPQIIDLGPWRYAASAVALLILSLIVLLPLGVLVLTSVLPFYEVPSWETLRLLTGRHYRFLAESSRVARALQVSVTLAVLGATLAMILTSVVAYLTVRTRVPGRGLLEVLAFIPWAFPGTALAIGLLWGYVRLPVPIYATIWILLIAYVTRFLPYGLRAMTSTMVQVHAELEEASRVSGAGLLRTFRRILLPLLRPGFAAGWVILATVFMREFSTSLFLYTPRAEPVGPLLYHLWVDGYPGRMAALGVVISLASVALVAAARRATRAPWGA